MKPKYIRKANAWLVTEPSVNNKVVVNKFSWFGSEEEANNYLKNK